MPTIIRFLSKQMGCIPIDICHGEIPDIFRTSMFGPTSELELPDAKGPEDEFRHFLNVYRIAFPTMANIVLGWSQESDPGWWSQCN